MEAAFPEAEKSAHSMEGDAAHWVAAERIFGRIIEEGRVAPNDVVVSRAMVEGAQTYYESIEDTLAPYGLRPEQGAVEVAVGTPAVHERNFGTPDYRIWLPTSPRMTLAIWDYKFGYRVVEVVMNPQLAEYASGCISQTRLSDLQVRVVSTIVQPRAYHSQGPVRSWAFDAEDMRGLINIGHMQMEEALRPNPKGSTGSECLDCNGRHACALFQRSAQKALVESGRATPHLLSPAALSAELTIIRQSRKILEAREEALKVQALTSIKGGGLVPGYAVEHSPGRQRWKFPAAQVIAAAKLLNVDISKPPEALTPLQAIDAGLPEQMVRDLSDRPKSAATLVEDPGTKAMSIFGNKSR